MIVMTSRFILRNAREKQWRWGREWVSERDGKKKIDSDERRSYLNLEKKIEKRIFCVGLFIYFSSFSLVRMPNIHTHQVKRIRLSVFYHVVSKPFASEKNWKWFMLNMRREQASKQAWQEMPKGKMRFKKFVFESVWR